MRYLFKGQNPVVYITRNCNKGISQSGTEAIAGRREINKKYRIILEDKKDGR